MLCHVLCWSSHACDLSCSLAVQTLENKERGAEVQPNVLPSWAVPAVEGVPEAIQAAAQATTRAVKDAKDAVQSAVTAVTSPSPEKVLLCGFHLSFSSHRSTLLAPNIAHLFLRGRGICRSWEVPASLMVGGRHASKAGAISIDKEESTSCNNMVQHAFQSWPT